ncbi:type II secretion system protein J [Halobacillus litoralis]|uniref:PulJ/GspJ family protein n=1 Tax=Halobacillus litoralis TaxID=45668 RepID=UPI001CFE5A93|nr:prepilin-type N-terminal cleavage/methylation domain-containing protein [Halobacillus litoralis]
MNIHSERGFTLVEVLAVVSLSMIVLMAAYQAFYFVSGAVESSALKTELRKEANIIVLSLEEHLINVDAIDIPEDSDPFNAFIGTTRRLNKMEEETLTYLEDTVEVQLSNGRLFVEGVQINSPDMNLSNTTFEHNNGNLTVNLKIKKRSKDEIYTMKKIFRLGLNDR